MSSESLLWLLLIPLCYGTCVIFEVLFPPRKLRKFQTAQERRRVHSNRETQVAISYGVMDTVRSQSVLMANLRRLRHIGGGPDYGLIHWHVDLHKPIVWVCEIIRKGTPGRWREALGHVRAENVRHPGVSESVILHDSPMGQSMELASIQEGVRHQTV
ncbi:hypothetical protein NEOLEDRAFT_1133148 [Neolentinus lepideus HHB14362 ss-1]|uniref:Uncharacterized protein n=1 Tax=Neolentinus lepideus HHB14362 ss-1 TaxID=1314782 RepID=A0A165STN9_9AGAM|nr:hypothetical protein NEOLEDRAFT_1133148 [Neolentinus lepideus HHB14362 ss-1]